MIVLSILAVPYIAINLFILFAVIVSDKQHITKEWDKIYKENEDGLLDTEPLTVRSIFMLPVMAALYPKINKFYISEKAEIDAKKTHYNNRFANEKIREIYDNAYLKMREKIIVKKAEKDVDFGRNDSVVFKEPSEKVIYQETYLKKVTGQDTAENIIKERYEALNDRKKAEPVSDEDFEEIVKNN